MARLQILELPSEHHGDDTITPFVLVIDRVQNSETMLDFLRDPPHLRDELGARTVLVFDEEVEIPANETSADPEPEAVSEPDYTEMATLVGRALGIDITVGEPDVAGWLRTACRELLKSDDARAHLQDELSDARLWARHGYEIGQKHCGWTDHGTAPVWLTDGWPNSFDACEHLKRAAELEASEGVRKRVAKEQKAALLDALGMDPTRDWDDIRNSARGLRAVHEAEEAALDRVRDLPEQQQRAEGAEYVDVPQGAEHVYEAAYHLGYRNAILDAKQASRSVSVQTPQGLRPGKVVGGRGSGDA